MKGHRPIFWSQGLFLHPQHFQIADDVTNNQVNLLRNYGLPYFWGIHKLSFNLTNINNALSVESLEAIFPSGAAVNVPFDANLAPLAFTAEWPYPDKDSTLYLGLSLLKNGEPNATMEGEATFAKTRFTYTEDPDMVPDMFGKAPPAPVQRLKFAPLLIRDIDLEHYTNFECMPIALLRRIGEHVELDPHFLPPLLSIHAHSYSKNLVQEVLDAALSCAGRLYGYKSTVSTDAPDMRFVINFSILGVLNHYIPLLVHLQSGSHIHPWHIYGLLRTLAGELSSFFNDIDCLGRSTQNSEGIPNYCHENPNTCFVSLCKMLIKLMASLGAEESKSLLLLPEAPYFAADIPDNFISASGQVWLCVRLDEMTEGLADDIPRFVKIGSKDKLNTIIAKAISGVELTKVAPPPGFLRRKDTAWYRIDTSHSLWQQLITQKRAYLFWEGAPEDAEVKLVVTGQ